MKTGNVSRPVIAPDHSVHNENRTGRWGVVKRAHGMATADDAREKSQPPRLGIKLRPATPILPLGQGKPQAGRTGVSEIASITALLDGLRADPDLPEDILSMPGITVLENYRVALEAIAGLTRGLVRE